MEKESSGERIVWVDCLKLFACLAVYVDHTSGFLYFNPYILYASYFSVPVFIFLSGMTGYGSNSKHVSEPYLEDMRRRLLRIVIPYAIATAFYVVYIYRMFDLKTYILSLLRFDISAPFYFLVFYIQLVMIGRGLYKLIQWTGKRTYFQWIYLFEIFVFVLFAALMMRYTYVLPVHGGGKYLFGGTYLVVYFLGMIFGKYCKRLVWGGKLSCIVCACSIALSVLWVIFMVKDQFQIDARLMYFGAVNPPGFTLVLYTGMIILAGWSLDGAIRSSQNIILNKLWKWISRGGKYSLYVYLFHLLFLSIFQRKGGYIQNIWMKRIACSLFVFGGCYIIGVMIEAGIKKYIRSEEQYGKNKKVENLSNGYWNRVSDGYRDTAE